MSEETLSKLADSFNDKLHLRCADYYPSWQMIQDVVKLLRDANAVDYSASYKLSILSEDRVLSLLQRPTASEYRVGFLTMVVDMIETQ